MSKGPARVCPLHGGVTQDSHRVLPVDDRSLSELEQKDLIPFIRAIPQGAHAVLTAHILYPRLDPNFPASLSPRITTGLLRDQLGFHGLIITDALEMGAISHRWTLEEAGVRAIEAGADMVIIYKDVGQVPDVLRALREAIQSGELPISRVRQAVTHVRSALKLVDSWDRRAPARCSGP